MTGARAWIPAAALGLAGAGFLLAAWIVLSYGFSTFGAVFALIGVALGMAGAGLGFRTRRAGLAMAAVALAVSGLGLLWASVNAGDEVDYNVANAAIGLGLLWAASQAFERWRRGDGRDLRWVGLGLFVAGLGTAAYVPIELLKGVTDYLVGDVLSTVGFLAAAWSLRSRLPGVDG